MHPVAVRVAKQALTAKGFVALAETDHEMFFFLIEGRKTNKFFKISHGEVEISRHVMGLQARTWQYAGAKTIGASDVFGIISCSIDSAQTQALLDPPTPPAAPTPEVDLKQAVWIIDGFSATLAPGMSIGIASLSTGYAHGKILRISCSSLTLERSTDHEVVVVKLADAAKINL